MTDWSERFETGDPQIDADHREFFRRIAALKAAFAAGAPANRAAELLQLLHDHALAHFQREELTMAHTGCNAHAENCAAHQEFARKLDGWTQLLCLSGPTPSLVEDIHRESAAWMRHHILRVDCRLRGCLAAKTDRSATAADV
ncbi:MAG: hemerythrin family protein [Candidatus Didemnitutus sp.]|nr:hemerythrin family protein [Candidatus Didemnitutus sp.]